MLTKYLGAVRYAGAALEWRDGPVLHTEEVVDAHALPAALRRWAARTDTPGAASRRIPASALLMATAHVDFGAVADGLIALVPEVAASKIENFRLAFNGLLLGLDVRSDVLARLGPGGLVYVERPEGNGPLERLPVALSVETGGGEKVGPAIDNALRTFLAIYALDNAHGGGRLRVESRKADGTTVTALNDSTPFAYAIRDNRLFVGTTPGAVGRALTAASDPRGSSRVNRVRSVYFPDAVSFALADLRGIHDFAALRRVNLARLLAARQQRPESETARDLDQALALLDLFDAAYFTTTITPDFTRVHHAFGLVRLPQERP